MSFMTGGIGLTSGYGMQQPVMSAGMGVQWTVTPEERRNYDVQFGQLNPMAGFLSGNQARTFFLNSNLPPAVLSQIWELADFTGDGKMDKLEFSIAMKLIKLTLKGATLPAVLPLSMKQGSVLGTGGLSQPMSFSSTPSYSMSASNHASPIMSQVPMISNAPMAPLGSVGSAPMGMGAPPIGPLATTPYSQPASSSTDEWGVPKHVRLKYTQMFNSNDREKKGYLLGNQSRYLLTRTGLTHMVLADIWNVSDIDKDGKLTREEFILAMHLTDLAKSGNSVPKVLPANLIPPSFRKLQSVTPQPMLQPIATDNLTLAPTNEPSLPMYMSFEDRRRDNFNKGNAELEKRRQALLDTQRKENERLEQKEREQREKREKERQEAERRKQQELERRLEQQREIERQREEERRKAFEQREAAKREMERQRKMEWERTKRQELLQQKAREQEEVTTLHAKTKTLDVEIVSLNEKKEQLTVRVRDLNSREQNQRSAIETINNNRNIKQMQVTSRQGEIQSLNKRLNQELIPEKQFLMQRLNYHKVAQSPVPAGSPHLEISSKKSSLSVLRLELESAQRNATDGISQLELLNAQLNRFREDINKHRLSVESKNRTQQDKVRELQEARRVKESSLTRKNSIDKIKREQRQKAAESFMTSKINEQKLKEVTQRNQAAMEESKEKARLEMELNLKQSQEEARMKAEEELRKEEVKRKIQEMQKKRLEKSMAKNKPLPPSPLDKPAKQPIKLPQLTPESSSISPKTNGVTTASIPPPVVKANHTASAELTKFKALYTFEARNADELSITQDDIIMVDKNKDGEPGWYFGKKVGKSGWFPANYVQEHTEEISIPQTKVTTPVHEVKNDRTTPVQSTTQQQLQDRLTPQDNAMLHPSKSSAFSTTAHSGTSSPVSGAGIQVTGMRYRALYPWQAKKENHLTFEKDAIIDVTEKQSMWWFGSHAGKSGWFPKSYVKDENTPSIEKKKSPTAKRKAPAPPKGAVAVPGSPHKQSTGTGAGNDEYVSVYAFEAQEGGDLNFRVGETIIVTGRDGDWWSGTCNNRSGIFPANYVAKKQQEEKPAKSSGSTTVSGREIATVIAAYTATGPEQLSLNVGQLVLIKKKNDTGWWEGEIQVRGKKRQIGWFPANYVKVRAPGDAKPTAAKAVDKEIEVVCVVMAMYDYSPQNDDELTFARGTEINVIEKSDADWWKGYVKTKPAAMAALFPANYVRELTADQWKGKQESVSSEERRRQQHIHELIVSEESYWKDLQCADEAFQQPVRKSKLLTEQEMNTLFVNWNDLIMCSAKLVKAFRVRRKMSGDGNIGDVVTLIGDILCEQIPNFHPYLRFCSCQLNASSLLQEKLDNSSEFKALVKKCEANPQWKGLPVSSYLVKPMQRITKYPLLVEKILKHTPETHPDHTNLRLALERAEEICVQVNEGVREKENADRLEWLQAHVQMDNLKLVFNSKTNCLGQRRYLHCGVLCKNKSSKELVGFLLNDFLLLTTPLQKLNCTINDLIFTSKINMQFRIYKMPIFLNEVLVKLPTDPTISNTAGGTEEPLFHLSHIDRVYTLRAETINERTAWINKIKSSASDYLSTEKKKREKAYQARSQRSSGIGRLMVTIVEGDKLVETSSDRHDPYCEVTMGVQCHTTKTVQDTLNPKWNASMQFFVKDLNEDVLCISVFQRDMFSPDDFLGRTEIKVADIKKDIGGKGPITKRLLLHEVESGEVVIKVDLQLFET